MRSRGSAPKALERWPSVGVVLVVVLLVVSVGGSAEATPVGQQFAPSAPPVTWNATTGDGTAESAPVTVDSAEMATGGELPNGAQLTAGQHYFYVALHPNYEFAGVLTPIAMPPTGATLTTAGGTVSGVAVPPNTGNDDQWYFPVSDDISSATLHVDGFTKVLGNERGDFIPWTFGPLSIGFVATAPVPVTTPTTLASANGHAGGSTGTHRTGLAKATSGGTSVATPVGVGAAGAVAIAAGAAGLVSLVRRRRFYRADREGRVVLSGPPALLAGATMPIGAALPSDRQAIVVKLLGPLALEGTKRPVTAGPLLEIIVFLSLNPGKSFTSVQLRESIWGLGRQPIKSQTFRSYMMQLRRAFGPGVVVTDVYRYQLTSAVTSDWDQFQAALRADEILDGTEAALSLVRGPVLHGSFDGRKNSPFSWAVGIANDIEDQVTNVAAELAIACIESGDPPRAASALSQGLLCSESNLRLRTLDLEVGVAIGGLNELGRRLAAAQAAVATFPKDVAELEQAATQLGWVAPISG